MFMVCASIEGGKKRSGAQCSGKGAGAQTLKRYSCRNLSSLASVVWHSDTRGQDVKNGQIEINVIEEYELKKLGMLHIEKEINRIKSC